MTSCARAQALAFVAAFVTLAAQVLVHRMVSGKLLQKYAFLVISRAFIGFAVSGVIVPRYLRRFIDDFADTAALCAALFALTMVGSAIVFYWAPASVALC